MALGCTRPFSFSLLCSWLMVCLLTNERQPKSVSRDSAVTVGWHIDSWPWWLQEFLVWLGLCLLIWNLSPESFRPTGSLIGPGTCYWLHLGYRESLGLAAASGNIDSLPEKSSCLGNITQLYCLHCCYLSLIVLDWELTSFWQTKAERTRHSRQERGTGQALECVSVRV